MQETYSVPLNARYFTVRTSLVSFVFFVSSATTVFILMLLQTANLPSRSRLLHLVKDGPKFKEATNYFMTRMVIFVIF